MAVPKREQELEQEAQQRTLFAFDFDHTLLDGGSDSWCMSICPELDLRESMKDFHDRFDCWPEFMNHNFSLINEVGNKTKEDILYHMSQLRLHDQALRALQHIHKQENINAIIISDANTIFIDHILNECGVSHIFKDIFSNPAHFEPNGRLKVKRFHSHSCDRCVHTPNMCKGTILRDYLDQHLYDKVVYVGDGRNDFCPSVSLRKQDVVLCRDGFSLSKLMNSTARTECSATVHIIDFMQTLGDFIVANN